MLESIRAKKYRPASKSDHSKTSSMNIRQSDTSGTNIYQSNTSDTNIHQSNTVGTNTYHSNTSGTNTGQSNTSAIWNSSGLAMNSVGPDATKKGSRLYSAWPLEILWSLTFNPQIDSARLSPKLLFSDQAMDKNNGQWNTVGTNTYQLNTSSTNTYQSNTGHPNIRLNSNSSSTPPAIIKYAIPSKTTPSSTLIVGATMLAILIFCWCYSFFTYGGVDEVGHNIRRL